MVALVAVGAVTFMIFWMRKHARGLKRELEGSAAAALARRLGRWRSSGWRSSPSSARASRPPCSCSPPSTPRRGRSPPAAARCSASSSPCALGWGIYRGGVKINLARFFRVTSVVLVLVAAGLARERAPHRARGGVDQQLPDAGLRPRVARRAGQRPLGAPHRHARPAAAARSWPRSPAISSTRSRCCWSSCGRAACAFASAGARKCRLRWARSDEARTSRRPVARSRCRCSLAACGGSSDELRLGHRPRAAAAARRRSSRTRSRSRSPTPAATRPRSNLPAGPTTFKVVERRRREGHRVRGARRRPHPRRGREHRAGPLAASSTLTLRAGRLHDVLPRRHVAGARHAHGHRRPLAGRERGRERRRRAVPRRTSSSRRSCSASASATFIDAVKAGDVAKAKALYAPARIPYERIEPVAESFGNLDPQIDAREGDVPAASGRASTRSSRRSGCAGTLAGTAHARRPAHDATSKRARRRACRPFSSSRLRSRTARSSCSVRSRSRRSPARRSATRTPTSSTSPANVEGAQAAFDALRPIVAESDPDLADDDRPALRRRRTALARAYRRATASSRTRS